MKILSILTILFLLVSCSGKKSTRGNNVKAANRVCQNSQAAVNGVCAEDCTALNATMDASTGQCIANCPTPPKPVNYCNGGQDNSAVSSGCAEYTASKCNCNNPSQPWFNPSSQACESCPANSIYQNGNCSFCEVGKGYSRGACVTCTANQISNSSGLCETCPATPTCPSGQTLVPPIAEKTATSCAVYPAEYCTTVCAADEEKINGQCLKKCSPGTTRDTNSGSPTYNKCGYFPLISHDEFTTFFNSLWSTKISIGLNNAPIPPILEWEFYALQARMLDSLSGSTMTPAMTKDASENYATSAYQAYRNVIANKFQAEKSANPNGFCKYGYTSQALYEDILSYVLLILPSDRRGTYANLIPSGVATVDQFLNYIHTKYTDANTMFNCYKFGRGISNGTLASYSDFSPRDSSNNPPTIATNASFKTIVGSSGAGYVYKILLDSTDNNNDSDVHLLINGAEKSSVGVGSGSGEIEVLNVGQNLNANDVLEFKFTNDPGILKRIKVCYDNCSSL